MFHLKSSVVFWASAISAIVASYLTSTADAAPTHELETRATPAAPHFVVYSDQWVSGENGPPDPSVISGFNVFALSFLLISGAADQALEWDVIGASARASIKSQYEAAGIKMIVSAFGSTDAPTSTGADPVATANTMAQWVISMGLDGIDVDYEDFNAFDGSSGSAVTWIESFTRQLRVNLPQGQYLLTHAPVAPWFEPNAWAGGGYLAINSAVGSLIDWYNIQFYNQGSTMYTTCTNLLTTSGGAFPSSSVFEIAANGVSLDKIVIGKPAAAGDADSGFIAPATLATCVQQAKAKGWDAGVMTWEFPDAAASWIATVRADSWPV